MQHQDALRIGGGVLIILFGLYIMGVLNIKFLSRERKFHVRGKPSGYVGSFFIGMTFAAGWTPCIGPILGSILLYASTTGSVSYGFNLLLVYSIGLGLPFFITSIAINAFLSRLTAIQRYMKAIIILSGLLLIAFGLMLLTDSLQVMVGLIPDFGFKF
jgi:cytochrome c-type biogenesis protein